MSQSAMSGGMVAMTLSHYTSWHPAWGPLAVVLTAGAIWLTARGVKLSTTAVGAAVLVQVAIMVAACVIVLVDQRAHLSGMPFSWVHLTGGLAWIAGIVSVLATLVAGADSQSRMLFDGGRTGLLPARLGHVRPRSGTPVTALLVMAGAGPGIIGVWWVSHLVSGDTGSMNPVGLYAELFKPGQPAPYSAFPFIALAIVAVAAVIAGVVVHRHPRTGAGEGAASPGRQTP